MQANKPIDFSGQSIDNFLVEKVLADYTASSLYLAHDTGTNKPVYLQIMNLPPGQDGDVDGRFRQQMRTLSQLTHPMIAPVQRIGRTPNNHSYAAIQYVSGNSLAQKLSEWREENHEISAIEALTLVRHLADALAVVHAAGIAHHDLQPENILIREDNTPALIDLGVPYIGKQEEGAGFQQTTTLAYASPEQLLGEAISGRSNIYSLGVILYELLAGHPPQIPVSSWDIFERATLPKEIPLNQAKPDLVDETYALVKTCLWRQEWSRFDTAYALVKAIDAALQAEEERAQRLLMGSRFPRWSYVVIPTVLLVAILAVFLLTRQGSEAIEVTALPETAVFNTLETPVAPPVVTETLPPPSPTGELEILLLAPTPGFGFKQGDTLFFDWYWPAALESDQQFSVHLVYDGGTQPIGITTNPITGAQYRIAVELDWLELEPGTYDWFVTLETAATTEILFSSERQSFIVQTAPATTTPTPSPTAETTHETASPTSAASCVPSPPSGWVRYTVQQGDFLFNLALATGTTVARIQEVNCLAEPVIGTGRQLWLPSLPSTETPTLAPTSVVPTDPPPQSTKPAATKTPQPPPLPTPTPT